MGGRGSSAGSNRITYAAKTERMEQLREEIRSVQSAVNAEYAANGETSKLLRLESRLEVLNKERTATALLAVQ